MRENGLQLFTAITKSHKYFDRTRILADNFMNIDKLLLTVYIVYILCIASFCYQNKNTMDSYATRTRW